MAESTESAAVTAVSTVAEKRWVSRVVNLGCVVCRNLGYGETPAICHHIREGQGAAQRAGNGLVIPLCPAHHAGGGHGVSFHDGPRTFERIYGSELDLLNQTILDIAGTMRE